MPKVRFDDFEEFDENAEPEGFTRAAPGASGSGDDPKWKDLFVPHPPSGGPFGGQDNALFKLVAFMRAKSFPIEAAHEFAQHWNRTYCEVPRLEPEWVHDKVSRLWSKWLQGGHEDATPEDATAKPKDAAPSWQFLTFAEMQVEEERVGKLQWILPNVLPVGGLVYFSAPPAGAKTWLLLDLVRALSSGGKWIGKYDVPQTGVLYIDEEMGVQKALPRLRKLGVTDDNCLGFWYTNKAGVRFDLAADVVRIAEHCTANKIGVVIVDTLTRVHRLDENDNSQMKALFERFGVLMQAGVTVLVAHHDRKGGVGEGNVKHERMRGAGEIAASADMSFSVDKRGSLFRLETTKGRLAAEDDFITVDFVVEDNEDKTRTVLREVEAGERSEKTLHGIEGKITDLLAMSGMLDTTAIKDGVRGTDGAILAALRRLVDAGTITESKGAGRTKHYDLSAEVTGEEEG